LAISVEEVYNPARFANVLTPGFAGGKHLLVAEAGVGGDRLESRVTARIATQQDLEDYLYCCIL